MSVRSKPITTRETLLDEINLLTPKDEYTFFDESFKLYDSEIIEFFSEELDLKLDTTKSLQKQINEAVLKLSDSELRELIMKVKEYFKPRPLSDKEIQLILDMIPTPPGVVKDVRDTARRQIVNSLRKTLEGIEITPLGIPELINKILRKFNRSLVEPASAVGIGASEAIAAPITQLTLNSVIGETEVVIADKETKEGKVVKIGEWIDKLLELNKDKIIVIPENRTEYLELEKSVFIPSTTCNGVSEWMELTAVTRHLPVGDLVKITTYSGREVTATSQKSFLVYSSTEDKLVEKNGKDLVPGDLVGVHLGLSNDDIKLLDEFSGRDVYKGRESLFDAARNYIFCTTLLAKVKPPFPVVSPINLNKPDSPYVIWKNIVLDPIDKIEFISSKDRSVYDVTVPKSLNFNLFNGLIMADTFHAAGSKKNISGGLEELKRILNLPDERKETVMTVEFKSKSKTYDETFEFREKYTQILFHQIITSHQTIQRDEIPQPSWYNLFLAIHQKVIPNTSYFLRLNLNVNMMIAHKITMSHLIKTITENQPPKITVIASPLSMGIIDIYPEEESVKQENRFVDPKTGRKRDYEEEFDAMLFLVLILLPYIKNKTIKGIPGIKTIYPTNAPVLSLILEEIQEEDRFWYIEFNLIQSHKTNMKKEDLYRLFNAAKIKPASYQKGEVNWKADEVKEDDLVIGVRIMLPGTAVDEKGKILSPSKYINGLIAAEERLVDEKEKEQKQKGVRGYIHPPPEIIKSSRYWYVDTLGSNFHQIVSLPDVDPYHTYSNNIHFMAKVLGIEAARNLIYQETRNIIMNEEYINPRHIMLLVDAMTNLGRPNGVSFTGANRTKRGPLVLASFMKPMEVLTKAAAKGTLENINSVAGSITTGKSIGVGTGFIKEGVQPLSDNVPSLGYSTLITKESYKKDVERERKKDALSKNLSAPSQNEFNETVNEYYNIGELENELLEETDQDPDDLNQAKMPDIRQYVTQPLEVIPAIDTSKVTSTIQISPPTAVNPSLRKSASKLSSINVVPTDVIQNVIAKEKEVASKDNDFLDVNPPGTVETTIVLRPSVASTVSEEISTERKEKAKQSLTNLVTRISEETIVSVPKKSSSLFDLQAIKAQREKKASKLTLPPSKAALKK